MMLELIKQKKKMEAVQSEPRAKAVGRTETDILSGLGGDILKDLEVEDSMVVEPPVES